MQKNPILLLLTLLFITSTSAQSWQDTVNLVEKAFEKYKPANPGAQLAISRDGKVIFSKAWGMADMEHNVPLTITSPTEAGSVSKQFTAAAILLLEQEGKLSLNDDVRKYVPELPDYGNPITLRQMMQHTSGLKDWGAVAAMAGWPRSTKTYNNDDAAYISSLQKTLNHKPGAEFLYSNSNYNLFAVIVERVSGQSLADYTRKKIFEPAGMKHTEWRANHKKIVRDRAIAYSKSPDGIYVTNMPNEYVYGNGGLLTTAEDLLTWTHYYATGKLGSPSLLQKQLATHPLNNGSANGYAAGLFVRKYNGIDMIIHDGATAGYRANLEYYPSLGLTIAWLSNTSEFDGARISAAEAIRNIFITPPMPNAGNVQQESFVVKTEQLNNYTGWYSNNRTGAGLKVSMKDDQLNLTLVGAVRPLADRVFAVGNNRIEFFPGRKGFMFISGAKDSIYFTARDSADASAAAMQEYAGEYYSDEAQATYFVIIKNGKPVLQQKPKTEYTLTPTYKDGFDLVPGAIYFERDKKNKITGFKFSAGRARNVAFIRK